MAGGARWSIGRAMNGDVGGGRFSGNVQELVIVDCRNVQVEKVDVRTSDFEVK